MKLKVFDITEEGYELNLSEDIVLNEQYAQKIPVEAHLKLYRDGASVIITGYIDTETVLECSRCLETFNNGLRADVNIMYLPSKESGLMDERHKLSNEELNTGFYSEGLIDVSDLVSEQVSLNIPIKPLCSVECKGLCRMCGTDLNSEKCDCDEELTDRRWLKLKKIIDERKE
ncbi:hypothetical protein BMS3Abin07_01918 [bacterium BMS3Abin07]|nr:hypothetical protein BMS3Abin07_01918 [bacterium BMS3Abin07]HDL20144.1 DUF177 domain-containing protein [Nitrospirota bacterium]HDO22843.1 DUF177 domain-containing protein [Nitrospirota bacterium]HDZ88306.1 DUF177 domain-containing protein [Nitrospirota bacterium]